MKVARKTGAALMLAGMCAAVGCKNKTADNNGEVTVIGMTPLPASASAAAPTPTGVVNAGMADLTPPPDPFQGAAANTGVVNPGLIGGQPSDPSIPPMTALPATLPKDPGGASSIKIVPMHIAFAVGRSLDQAADLKKDGSLLFDNKRLAKIAGNKVVINNPKNSLSLRSDGFVVAANPKNIFFERDAIGMTLPNGFRIRIAKDNKTIVSDAPGGGTFDFGKANVALGDDRTKTTALMIASAEMSGFLVPPPTARPQVATTSDPSMTGLPDGTYSFSGDIDLSKAVIVPNGQAPTGN